MLKTGTKEKQGTVVSKKNLKELAPAKGEPLVKWTFESSSMAVGGNPIMYITQLNKDGSLSCNCAGWCLRKERICKHTKAVASAAKQKFAMWKKTGKIPLGDDFELESVQAAHAGKSAKIEEGPETQVLVAKRIITL